ncbi:MAG: hypothetical protein IJN02_02195 [Bacteroidales bacterium]|nr:hypothetical protein [Bacteroidales bacterium]
MKKIIRLMAALAATTVAFSCMEEANPEMETTKKGTHYDGPMTTLTFNLDELETKTTWDGETHAWEDGDQIKIVYGTEDDAFTTATVNKGTVTATVGDVETYYAVYPAKTVHSLVAGETDAQLSIVIPQTQDGSFGQANIMAAKTTKEESVFAFKNLTHIFKFTLSEDAKHKGFQFMSNSSNELTSGGLSLVSFNADSKNPVTVGKPVTGKIGETTYEQSAIVQVGDLKPGGTYYIGLCPDTDMAYGFGFKATKTGGTTNWSEGALTTTSVTTNRSEITFIPNLDKSIRDHWFFKSGANGDGSSWENAGGETLLIKLLGSEIADGVNYNKNTNGWRLYGAELHLAAGKYTLPETIGFYINVNNKTAIYGGYPDNLSGTSLEGRDPSQNPTIITKDGGTRLFAGNGSTLYNWTWDGITFTMNEGTTATDRGGAFYFNASTTGTVTFKDCTFTGMETTHSNGGGAIDINTATKAFNATFTGCKFTNNTGKLGGAVVIEDGRSAKIKFTECEFKNNKATTAGGAIANKVGTIIIDNCLFQKNSSTNHGGAICTYGEELSGGALITGKANAYIYNTLFYENSVSSTNQGGTIKAHGNGNLVIVNSTFTKSTANTGIIRLRAQSQTATDPNLKAWIISSTFADNNKYSLYNQSSTAYIYNSILNDPSSLYSNQANGSNTIKNSFFNNTLWYYVQDAQINKGSISDGEQQDASVIDKDMYDDDNGVFPVSGIALTGGMSSSGLAALGEAGSELMTAMPLFETKYLTVDQKGNERTGSIMGAYVGQ